MDMDPLDLMSTQEILEYLGRKRFRSMACAGVPNSNHQNEISVSCFIRGSKFIDIVQEDMNLKIDKFKADNPNFEE